jgi:hypothetical protein
VTATVCRLCGVFHSWHIGNQWTHYKIGDRKKEYEEYVTSDKLFNNSKLLFAYENKQTTNSE